MFGNTFKFVLIDVTEIVEMIKLWWNLGISQVQSRIPSSALIEVWRLLLLLLEMVLWSEFHSVGTLTLRWVEIFGQFWLIKWRVSYLIYLLLFGLHLTGCCGLFQDSTPTLIFISDFYWRCLSNYNQFLLLDHRTIYIPIIEFSLLRTSI